MIGRQVGGVGFGNHMVHISSSGRRHFGGKFGICRPGEVEEEEVEEEKRRRRKKEEVGEKERRDLH